MLFTIEQLAKRTGVPMRALHRFDATGLLVPSGRCESGGRRYNQKDVVRLYRILGLKRLGLSSGRIGTVLAENHAALPEILDLHLITVDQQIAAARKLRSRLADMHERVGLGDEPTLTEWLTTLELMAMYEAHIAVEQTNRFIPIREETPDAWPALIAAMRSAMERGLSPRDREIQRLAQRWMDLLRHTAAYDSTLLSRYARMQRAEFDEPLPDGVDTAMLEYLSAALWAKHLTLDEMERLRKDGPKQCEWPSLIAALRDEMNRGTAVRSPRVQELLREWESLLDDLTQGDATLSRKWIAAVRSDPDLWIGSGVDGRLQHYIQRARMAKEELLSN
jgi:DNA-binding transcriptional MerR regulator